MSLSLCAKGVHVPRNTSPIVMGQPPMLIHNSDLMDQLYFMGDEFKELHSTIRAFNTRLSAVEKKAEKFERTNQVGRYPASGHRL